MQFRNTVSRFLVMLLWWGLTLLVCSYLFIALVYGPSALQLGSFGPGYLSNQLVRIQFLWQQIWYYASWMIENEHLASLTAHNFLIAKVFGVPLLVCGISGWLFSLKYLAIMEWKPFKKKEEIYGAAHWATEEEIKKANLRDKQGLLLGQNEGGYFISGGYGEHVLLFAPTGSGKGVGFVIPNLLFWQHSCIVHDMKLENYEITSGWRASQGQSCYLWSPTDPDGRTHCYNPFDWVSPKPGQMVDDVQKMGSLIVPAGDGAQSFWNNEARALFVGIVLYLLAAPERTKSFGEVLRTIRGDDVPYNLAVILDTIGKQIHPVGYMNLAAFLNKADKERSGVMSTLSSELELWSNPFIDAATAKSDFNLQEMKKKKMTVYVGITPDNLTRVKKLMQVFYQQAIDFMTRKLPDKKTEPYEVLFLMDEFPTIGKMPAFLMGIAFFRGYNVRLFLVTQDTQQLKETYTEPGMNSFLSNSKYRVTYAANNIETATLISQMCGNKTVESISESKPKFLDFSPGGKSQNVSQAQRALLLPQEVITLPRDEEIIMVEAVSPIKAKKIFWYKEKLFMHKPLPRTDVPTQAPYDPTKAMGATDDRGGGDDGSDGDGGDDGNGDGGDSGDGGYEDVDAGEDAGGNDAGKDDADTGTAADNSEA